MDRKALEQLQLEILNSGVQRYTAEAQSALKRKKEKKEQ